MGSKFVKRSTAAQLEIEGETYSVDFGRDGIQAAIEGLSADAAKIEKAYESIEDVRERRIKIEQEHKAAFKRTINEILGDESASDRIFAKDDSALFHADVYNFLIEEYTGLIQDRYSEYSPNRAARRASGQ